MENRDVSKLAVLFSLISVNITFILILAISIGYLFGAADSKKSYIDGARDGEKKGCYEIYLELERRDIGVFNPRTDEFVFYSEKKER